MHDAVGNVGCSAAAKSPALSQPHQSMPHEPEKRTFMLRSIARFSRWLRASTTSWGMRFRASSTSCKTMRLANEVQQLQPLVANACGNETTKRVCKSAAAAPVVNAAILLLHPRAAAGSMAAPLRSPHCISKQQANTLAVLHCWPAACSCCHSTCHEAAPAAAAAAAAEIAKPVLPSLPAAHRSIWLPRRHRCWAVHHAVPASSIHDCCSLRT